jgi:hypothetical protein
MCWEDIFSYSAFFFISNAFQVRNKIMWGIQCFDKPNCVSFACIEDGKCWLYSSRITYKSEACSEKNCHYGEFLH